MSVRLLWLAAILGAAILVACSSSEAKPAPERGNSASDATVAIRTFQFQPSPLEVKTGTAVVWTNQDQILHTVTSGTPGSRDGRFDGPLGNAGATFTVTFSEPGTYAYFCSRHESMRGEVRVQ